MENVIKLMPEFQCFPLWRVGGEVDNVNPDDLPLTSDLQAAIRNWAFTYDSTLNQEYPPDSGFQSGAEEEAFELEGRRIWQELMKQLSPDFKIIYQSVRDNRMYE